MARHAVSLLVTLALSACAQQPARPLPAAERARDASRTVAPGSTFCNPIDLDYRFALDTPSRRDVADPVIVRLSGEYYLFAGRSGGYWRSRDLRDWQLVVPSELTIAEAPPRVLVLDGRIYHASEESAAIHTSDDPARGVWRAATPAEAARASEPLRDWQRAEAVSLDAGGFAGRIESVSKFRDSDGNRWSVVAMNISPTDRTERRLGIFPVIRDGAGTEQIDLYPGDHPRLLPGTAGARAHDAVGWMLLSAGKKAAASSSLPDHPPELAFDEKASSWWSAASGGVGEWLTVDLGAIARVAALQINFAEQGAHALGRDEDSYHQYIVESSIDGVHWTTRLDESSALRDTPHRYVQLDTARNARFVRITNVHAAAGGNFAIRDLRIFGRSPVGAPAAVGGVAVQRGSDPARATVTWRTSARAAGYIVRYGVAPDRLHSSRRVDDVASLTLDDLDRAVTYWFAVDAIGEGEIARATGPVEGRAVR